MLRRRFAISWLLYWIAIIGVFFWASWLRLQAPWEPVADPDVWGYLSPAVNKLTGGGFTHSGRNFVYPGFLYLLLRAVGDFRAITFVQHFLGLMGGALMLGIWQRTRALIRDPALPESVHRWLGLLPVAIYLWAADSVRMEMQIRPEAICGFLGMANVFLAVQFSSSWFLRGDARAARFYAIGTVLTALVFGSVRPSFWLPALCSILPMCFVFLRRKYRREQWIIGVAALAGVALIVLPERLLARNDEVDAAFVPMLLFAQHAGIIRDQIDHDLAGAVSLPYGRDRLERIHSSLSVEIRKSFDANPSHYPSLGFDPEYLMYADNSIHAQLSREFHDDVGELCRFYRFYYLRAFLHQPGRMLTKIARQISLFYGERCGAYNWGRFLDLQAEYSVSAREVGTGSFGALFLVYPPANELVKRSLELARAPVGLEQRGYIRYPLYSLSKRYVPCLMAAIVFTGITCLRGSWRWRWGWLATSVLFLFWYSFAACLETALVNSLEVYRYLTVLLAFVILAQFLTLLLTLEFSVGTVRASLAPRPGNSS